MNAFNGKRIFIFQQRGWATTIGQFLAEKLTAEGAELGALTLKRTTHDFILKQTKPAYSLVISHDDIMSEPEKYLDNDTFTLAEICRELGIDSIWPIVYSLRNHVKSYKDKYYYSFKQNVSDEAIIDYVKAIYKCIRIVFKDFKPDLILTPNFVALPHIMFNLYAKKHGVPMIGVTDSKVQGNYIFTYDYQESTGPFHDRLDALNQGLLPPSPNLTRAKIYIQEFRTNFKAPETSRYLPQKTSFYRRLRHEIAPYYYCLRWFIDPQINVLKSTGITADYRPPHIILRDHYAHAYNKYRAENFGYYPLEKIGPAIYFPLQFQPESSIDVSAPFFNNQMETARQVAMSMPDDYTLIVKEHPAMIGYRPASCFEKLSRTVNVKLVDYRIPSQKILEKAALVVSPNSTTIAEAAFLHKPAIQLGNIGTLLKLPNVFHHTNFSTLASAIKTALAADLHTPEYERRLENYVTSAYDAGFNFDYIMAWETGKKDDLETLWVLYRSEIELAFGISVI